MSETEQVPFPDAADGTKIVSSEAEAQPAARALFDRTGPLLTFFLLVGLVCFAIAFLTVHRRRPEDLLQYSQRPHSEIMHWLNEGYFHYSGMRVISPPPQVVIYRSGTGGHILSAFILEKLYIALTGHYSWRLIALHNQVVPLLLSALLGLLSFRITRRIGLDVRLALVAGASIVMVVFTFPCNLNLYWELWSQPCFLLYATVFLLAGERRLDAPRPIHTIVQIGAAFLLTFMEKVAGLAFVAAIGIALLVLEQQGARAWRRYMAVAVIPCLAAVALYAVQLKTMEAHFPNTEKIGSGFMFRSGLDGESRHYGDHLDIGRRRDGPRANWPVNREHLFRWPAVFYLGSMATLVMIGLYVARRVPRIAAEALIALAGTWVLYAAVFSQAVKIHPWLYDVLLFVPLSMALFAFLPAFLESTTRRSGAILLLAVFCAVWYAFFQMRLYALWYPMPGAAVGAAPKAGG